MQDLIQFIILCLSGVSIWAFAGKRHRLGFICGLCGQPFWIFTTWTAGQWGMFILSLWFTGNHVRGLWNHRNRCKHDWFDSHNMTDSFKECSKCGARKNHF